MRPLLVLWSRLFFSCNNYRCYKLIASTFIQFYDMSFFDEVLDLGAYFVLDINWYTPTLFLHRDQRVVEYRNYPVVFDLPCLVNTSLNFSIKYFRHLSD